MHTTAAQLSSDRRDVLLVALVIPLHGPAGIFGLSCELSARLAAEELNAAGGVLDREVRLVVVDGGGAPRQVAEEVAGLVALGAVDAVVGWHDSAVRRALAPRIAHRVPYIYTAQYEGGEQTPGVFLTGETDVRQLGPAMRLLSEATGARRWCTVGSDYVWPRVTARTARRVAGECGGRVVDEVFVPLGTEEFGPVVRRVETCGADAVLMLLLGDDAVRFGRAFAAVGLHQRCIRLSTHMDENLLLATGAEAAEGLWAAAGYFDSLMTSESLSFGHRYTRRFGDEAPVAGSLGESCFEGMMLLGALAEQRGSLAVSAPPGPDDTISYEGPRGALRLRGNHLEQRLYLARADALDFEITARL
ncbi:MULTISPECIES: substrate-binding domain-containing protein [unclassified Streptomyces]|uniref:substrate-binding domain-containing protein n=1 Tax=unclassified Streptomyces TaxID=2593676 RepID=UPI0007F49876|nr:MULTISPECIES: substrate-binding domain-containing protein [unclassified Streptomyces]MCM1976311.1 substrate-binding domain-containing protein [Streptomyces sp. G1]SBT90171.1 amino acid/amide ABC transporter substrate-binding protein, HAAT family [Streptomyces sp. DI166]